MRQDRAGEIKAVLVVQVDTASGAMTDIAQIRRTLDAAGHGALLLADTIASLGTMPFEMDAWGIDVAVAGSQKGLMTGTAVYLASDDSRLMTGQTLVVDAGVWMNG